MTQRRKLAIVTPYGGEPRFDNYAEFNLAKGLIEKGWDVRMYTYRARGMKGYTEDIEYKGVPVYRCRHRLGISPRLFLLLLRFRPDAVIGFHPKDFLNFTAYRAARWAKAKFVVQIVGLLHDPYFVTDTDDPIGHLRAPGNIITGWGALFKRLLAGKESPLDLWKNFALHYATKRADLILAMNKNEMEHIEAVYGKKPELVYWCAPKGKGKEEEKRPDIDIPEHYLFFIGQIKKRKGWDTAIETIAALRKKGFDRHLLFISPFPDVRVPNELAEKLGVRDLIHFHTVTTDERDWLYRHADAVLIPSRYEGFGIPVFEAFLADSPICVTDINTFKEFLNDRENAMMTPMEDGSAMAESVLALESDAELRRKVIEGGRRSLERFSAERMVENFERAILSTLR